MAQGVVLSNGRLTINGRFQLDAANSGWYHECIVALPALFTPAKRILILGGGDGCAADVARRFAEEVVVVDYDPRVLRLGREAPDLLRLNHGSLQDPKVRTVVQDAVDFTHKEPDNSWDTVVMDFTATDGSAGIDSPEFHFDVERILAPGGAWSRVLDMPWSVTRHMVEDFSVRHLDVVRPTHAEGFLIALEDERRPWPSTLPLEHLSYEHREALLALPALTLPQVTALARFEC